MDALKNFFDTLGGWVWGPAMLVLLVGTGVWLTLMLRGLQFSMLWFALKQAFKPHGKKEDGSDHEGDISHFGALMTALSATIGTGNIAGVATAVVLGGSGAPVKMRAAWPCCSGAALPSPACVRPTTVNSFRRPS